MAKKTGNYSEDELLMQLVSLMGNPFDTDYDDKEAIRIFGEIGKIDGAMELFRSMMARDIKLHFQAQSDKERSKIEGMYARMAYIRGIIKKINEKEILEKAKSPRIARGA